VPYPNFPDKYSHAALFEPQEFLAYLREQGALHPGLVPDSFVLLYERRLFEHVERDPSVEPVAHRNRRYYSLAHGDKAVGVAGGFGAGAPAVTMVLEELIALGARRFVSIGFAGAIDPTLAIGDVVVCNEAIRDEGVSHHYLAPDDRACPSRPLTERLQRALARAQTPFVTGPTWTIDTPYRETAEEVRHYRAAGVLTVEMEAAALFAVSAFRNIDIAAAFVISDLLSDDRWHAQFHDAVEPLRHLYTATLDAFSAAV
jgi:uridine phosphorylase